MMSNNVYFLMCNLIYISLSNFLIFQFIELKGNVFKKFDRNNLFQMSCSDVRERFHYAILLFMVGVRNMAEFNWDSGLKFSQLLCFFLIFFDKRPIIRIDANGYWNICIRSVY
jgi:hypothetical protein